MAKKVDEEKKGPLELALAAINKTYGSGYLHMKIFKILNPKKNGGQGTSDGSDSARGV